VSKSVIGIVDSQLQAESIVVALQRVGFLQSALSVLFPDQDGMRDFAHEQRTKAPEGALAGVGAGGAIGGTLGLLVGLGTLAIPGVGPFLAAGPVLAALSGAAAGAAVGGIGGALVGIGIPEIVAKRYEGKISGGNILIAVHVESGEAQDSAEEIMRVGGARDVVATSEAPVPH
jgi:hypothetical protein